VGGSVAAVAMNSTAMANDVSIWNTSALAAPGSSARAGIAPIVRTERDLQTHGQWWLPPFQRLMGRDRKNCETSVTNGLKNFLCKEGFTKFHAGGDHEGRPITKLS
jgi:hypothetical protein